MPHPSRLSSLIARCLAALAQVPGLRALVPLAARLLGPYRMRRLLILAGRTPPPLPIAPPLASHDAPPPPPVLDALTPPLVRVDRAWAIPELGYLLIGWCLDPAQKLRRVRLESGPESDDELLARWVRVARPDVRTAFPQLVDADPQPGFIVLARTRICAAQPVLHVEAEGFRASAEAVEVRERGDTLDFARAVLGSFALPHAQIRTLMDRHVGPAIDAVWRAQAARRATPALRWFGEPPAQPELSVIVPLYGRYDFLRYQLARLADDADAARIELLYVVDDPSILAAVLALAAAVQPLFGLPLAVIDCGRNLGFAGANNLGAGVARGEHLLLLNSDVIPGATGWIEATLDALARLPDLGTLGAELLYEDDSVQHAGMASEPYADWGGLPVNTHPRKGFEPDGGHAPRRVQANTAAFLALRRALYLELGGLDEGFLLGDFEDSDLCRRIAARGLAHYLLPGQRLYHLERQSQSLTGDAAWKAKLTLFNGWRAARAAGTAGAAA